MNTSSPPGSSGRWPHRRGVAHQHHGGGVADRDPHQAPARAVARPGPGGRGEPGSDQGRESTSMGAPKPPRGPPARPGPEPSPRSRPSRPPCGPGCARPDADARPAPTAAAPSARAGTIRASPTKVLMKPGTNMSRPPTEMSTPSMASSAGSWPWSTVDLHAAQHAQALDLGQPGAGHAAEHQEGQRGQPSDGAGHRHDDVELHDGATTNSRINQATASSLPGGRRLARPGSAPTRRPGPDATTRAPKGARRGARAAPTPPVWAPLGET